MHLQSSAVAVATCFLALVPQPLFAQTTAPELTPHVTGVYVATNAASGNAIVAYRAAKNGLLTPIASYPTGGRGVGAEKIPTLAPATFDPLGSDASIRYVQDRRLLLVVNAGSSSVTSFAIGADDSLSARSVVPSGGLYPTSIAALGRLVYVANAGNAAKGTPATLSGFDLAPDGRLYPISSSTRTLSQPSTSVAATAVFSPDGRYLVVTDTTADRITTFAVRNDGRLGAAVSTPSSGSGPFGAIFHRGALLVAETQGGLPGGASLTSYRLLSDGHVAEVSASIFSGQTAGCWVASRAVTPYAYVADTGSGTISTFVQRPNGTLDLALGAAAPVYAPGGPVDLGLSRDGAFLYQLYDGVGKIGIFQTGSNGALHYIGNAGGLPVTGSQGLVVY